MLSFMSLLSVFRIPTCLQPSWRTSAIINTGAVACFSGILLGVLSYGYVRGHGINSAFLLYQGPCDTSSTVNFIAHLVLNVFGTAILASSNFFMQVVVAPSRDELDRAHSKGQWLDIGVPSLRNFAHLSRLKRLSWLALMVSSLPIHFLFNSAVFLIQSSDSTFTMTMAGKSFVGGGPFYPPGASLWNMEVPINCTLPANQTVASDCSRLPVMATWNQANNISLADYMDKSSGPNRNLSRAAAAQRNGWKVLDPDACKQQYINCGSGAGLQKYKDVVVIVEYILNRPATQGKANTVEFISEWTRDLLFPNMSQRDVAFWNQLVPPTANNSLWYTSECTMTQDFTTGEGGLCSNTCAKYLGARGSSYSIQGDYSNSTEMGNRVEYDQLNLYTGEWSFNFWDIYLLDSGALEHQMRSGHTGAAGWMTVKYCLAQPSGSQCKVGVSNVILLVVLLCVMLKSVQCFIILRSVVLKRGVQPLLTPGDAVDSLLRNPDQTTEKMSTLGVEDLQTTTTSHGNTLKPKTAFVRSLFQRHPGPRVLEEFPRPFARRWEARTRSYSSALTLRTWRVNYGVFLGVMLIGLVLFFRTLRFSQRQVVPIVINIRPPYLHPRSAVADRPSASVSLRGDFGVSSTNPFVMLNNNYNGRFLDVVLIANIPQFIISLDYLLFNGVLTRLHMAREWAAMSTGYRPLRVTQPRGQQTSTYTLQIPLVWGVASIGISVALHWLVSNSLYVYLTEGGTSSAFLEKWRWTLLRRVGFYNTPISRIQDTSLISNSGFIGLGYSPKGILATLVLFSLTAIIPMVLGAMRLPKSMVVVGTNSLAISAACHASARPGRRLNEKTPITEDPTSPFDETGSLLSDRGDSRSSLSIDEGVRHEGRGTSAAILKRLSESRIKWGVVQMPQKFYNEFAEDPDLAKVGHLSFGREEDGVGEIVESSWYV